ncbi:hypothetical protein HD806DRAFT_508813, partial [Xylariaceae sp. AK1471]
MGVCRRCGRPVWSPQSGIYCQNCHEVKKAAHKKRYHSAQDQEGVGMRARRRRENAIKYVVEDHESTKATIDLNAQTSIQSNIPGDAHKHAPIRNETYRHRIETSDLQNEQVSECVAQRASPLMPAYKEAKPDNTFKARNKPFRRVGINSLL